MYFRTTIVKSPAGRRDEMLAFIEQVKPKMLDMGAVSSWWVECGNDEWTQFTVYPSQEVAENAMAQARRNIQDAASTGAIDVQTVKMLEGTLVASL